MLTASKQLLQYVQSYWAFFQPKGPKGVMLDQACRWICPKKGLRATGAVIGPNDPIPYVCSLIPALQVKPGLTGAFQLAHVSWLMHPGKGY